MPPGKQPSPIVNRKILMQIAEMFDPLARGEKEASFPTSPTNAYNRQAQTTDCKSDERSYRRCIANFGKGTLITRCLGVS